MDAVNPDGERSGPPGVGLELSGIGYEDCDRVYFFFDGIRVATGEPDETGYVEVRNASVPGSMKPGVYEVTSSCEPSGEPIKKITTFRVTDEDMHRSSVVTSMPRPDQIPISFERIGLSAALAVLLLLLLLFPSQLFNQTFEENYDEIHSWMRLPSSAVSWIAALPSWVRLGGFMLLGGTIAAFLDPAIGFNMTTLALVIGLSVAVAAVTVVYALPRAAYMRRVFRDRGELNLLGGSLVVAIVCVGMSRLLDFQPGYAYGLLAGITFARQLDARRQGRLSGMTMAFVLALSVAAWFAWVPIAEEASQPGADLLLILVEAALVGTFLYGLEGMIIFLLPLRFMPGSEVFAWSRAAWSALMGLALFAVAFILLAPTTGYVNHSFGESAVGAIIVAGAFALFSVGFWAYFRLRAPRELPPPPVPEPAPQVQTSPWHI